MSKDIRSFFQVLSKKPGDHSKPEQKPKKAKVLIDSDDEDVIVDTPEKPSTKKALPPKRKVQVISSDSEDESKQKKSETPAKKQIKVDENAKEKPKLHKLKPVSLDLFDKPVKQSKVEHVPKPQTDKNDDKEKKKKSSKKSKSKKNTELGIHGDKDFEKTLEDLDEDSDDTILLDNLELLDKTFEEALASTQNLTDKKADDCKNIEKKENSHKKDKKETNKDTSKHVETQKNHDNKDKQHNKEKKEKDENLDKLFKEEKKNKDQHKGKAEGTPQKSVKRPRKNSESTPTPKKKLKLEHTDSGIDPDEEKFEKRRHSAALYQNYLHRGGPKNHGMKVYPKGKPDCLKGITFLRTGVLDSLEGEEFQNLVMDHGGRIVHGVSKKVNYLVVGEEPGPAKLEKARNYKIPEMNEDEFLDMILVKSGMKPKYVDKNDSEDFGLGGSENGSESTINEKSPKREQSSEEMEENYSSSPVKSENSHVNGKEEKETKVKIEKPIEDMEFEVKKEKKSPEKTKMLLEESKTSLQALVHTEANKNVKQEVSATQSPVNEKIETLSWTEKYKPSSVKDIIGQQDANSNMNKLKKWLQDWFKNQDPERRKKMKKPNPFNSCSGEYYKAALLSGPPGVGKTTTATLVAKDLGFDIVEFNASDTRNKKLLHEEISQMMNSKTVAGFASGEKNVNKKRVLLMDEVDGMAGNEDRGGIAELISFIKTANFPIICMCNNRDHQKMRTLVNHCYGLRFGNPNVNQVRGAMLSICFKEGLKIKPDALSRLIIGTRCDIRQTLNHLAMWSATDKNISSDCVAKESKNSQKDVVIGTWDVIRKVFTKSENKDMTLADKSRLFFYDYSMGPLFVQENYLRVIPECKGPMEEESLTRAYLTADSLSMSDLIESKIRSTNNWSLLESQAYYSTVFPSYYMSGKMAKAIQFPTWFGINSRRNKSLRMVSELYSHARTRISGDKNSMLMDYAEYLRNILVTPLKEKGTAGVEETLEVMKSYSLLRDDMLNLCELLNRFLNPNVYENISVNVKVALTKLYNKKMVLSFAPPVASKKKGAKGGGDEELPLDEEEENSDEEETEDNVTDDALIKVKTKAAAKAGSSKTSNSKSKGKTSSESQGKGKASDGKTIKGKGKK